MILIIRNKVVFYFLVFLKINMFVMNCDVYVVLEIL